MYARPCVPSGSLSLALPVAPSCLARCPTTMVPSVPAWLGVVCEPGTPLGVSNCMGYALCRSNGSPVEVSRDPRILLGPRLMRGGHLWPVQKSRVFR